MDEEDEHSPSEFYYPEDVETFDAETETVPYNKLVIPTGTVPTRKNCRNYVGNGNYEVTGLHVQDIV